ncbi:MAG: hypothetical protein GX051_04465 [Clostridiales bacterium]|nr:hypothetical protein [Clostridiales bacterium]
MTDKKKLAKGMLLGAAAIGATAMVAGGMSSNSKKRKIKKGAKKVAKTFDGILDGMQYMVK